MKVEITFHGPFRVETGSTRDGLAATVDRSDLLPASSLKGLMRASAGLLLPHRDDLIIEVFGGRTASGRRVASPWHWESADLDPRRVEFDRRARIAIDPRTGAGQPGFLLFGEEVWARTTWFDITRRLPLNGAEPRHRAVLAAAAAGVHALGADRRRGLGWVTFRPVDPPLDDALLAVFETLRSESASTGGPDA